MWFRPANRVFFAPVLSDHQPLIVNAIGHMAGTIVFSIFLALALRGGSRQDVKQNLLSVASAALAWVWNAGSFATLLLSSGSLRWVVESVSFCSLSFLPAVLLHLSLNKRFRSIAISGYVLSSAATVMHLSEGFAPSLHLHRWALLCITFGFGALTIACAVSRMLREGRETKGRASQIVASMCLLLFAVTFSHFGAGHPPQPWKELLVHHAGIPIALLILLQDYRFVFLDAFVRFLANVILAALLGYLGLRLAVDLIPENAPAHPLEDVIGVAGLCGLLILFAYLRGMLQRLLTRALFRTSSTGGVVQELRSKATEVRDESLYLEWAAERFAGFAGAAKCELLGEGDAAGKTNPAVQDLIPAVVDDDAWITRDPRWNWAEAIVPIRLSREDVRYLLLGRRRGGRRYFSEDLRSLSHLALVVVDEVQRLRAAEMQRLVSEAELRALHSQINPHFLFNALNTIYGVIPREATDARRTVLNLSDIFRYSLQTNKILIPLSDEIKIVKAYLEIERLRLGPRLQTNIQVDRDAEQILIPVLSVQPLVENAIKHGLARCPREGWLRLSATMAKGDLRVVVEDSGSGPAANVSPDPSTGTGLGLANVARRLQLCFGPGARLNMDQGEFGTRVGFSVPVDKGDVRQPVFHESCPAKNARLSS